MSGIIKALMAANQVRFYYDIRTGSLRDLSPDNRTVITTPGTARIARAANGPAFLGAATGYINVDPTGMQPPAAGLGLFFFINPLVSWVVDGTAKNFSGGSGGANRIQFYYTTGTSLIAYDGAISSISTAAATALIAQRRQFAGVTFKSGTISNFYVDGVKYPGSVALGTYSANPTACYLAPQLSTAMYAAIALDMNGVTDADVAALYRELVAAPGIVRRARTAFSIPHPVKSPAEYAAENVLFDLRGDTVSDQMPDVASGAYPAALTGFGDVVRGGPFTNGLSMPSGTVGTLPAGANNQCFQGSYSVEAWVAVHNQIASTEVFLSNGSANYVARSGANPRLSHADAGLVQRTTIGISSLITRKPQHLVYTVSVSGLNVDVNIYVDGVNRGSQAWATGFSPTTATVRVNSFGSGSAYFESDVYQVKYYKDRALTPTEVRTKYLEGARKCTLDAWVHSDGSCPITIVGRTSGEIANGWEVGAGTTWSVVEDAPVNGRPGKRWMRRDNSFGISTKSKTAFGSWHFEIDMDGAGAGNQVVIEPISTTKVSRFVSTVGKNGYEMNIVKGTGVWSFYRRTGAALAYLGGGSFAGFASGRSHIWITRSCIGVFSFWAATVGSTSMTFLGSVTDGTHTTSEYCVVSAVTFLYQFRGVRTYLGEMTPDEAIAAGVLDLR